MQSIITQREVINDISDYKMGIRFALRQSPDVIMIGEIRERETFEAVLDAAETGHLVISAIHTSDVLSIIDRLLGFFSHDERKSIQDRLSNTLEATVSLRLLSGITSNKIPA